LPAAPLLVMAEKQSLTRYAVNLLVTHDATTTAPIVYESRPSVQNLLGRVEHVAEFGALHTNFNMIRAGALHRANGGYLVLDAERLLMEPLAWDALKRTLYEGGIRIESLGELLSLVSTVSLEPQAIDIDVKVILIGERRIYYLLCELDPDFAELSRSPPISRTASSERRARRSSMPASSQRSRGMNGSCRSTAAPLRASSSTARD
jgi:predicted ATP-dependent protease